MAITVGTNSYITEAELTTYATDRGITITAVNKAPLLIKAMDYLETRSFIGTKTVYNQPLQFPRVLCGDLYDNAYPLNQYQPYYNNVPCPYDSTVVPNEIKTAQCIAALLIDGGADLQASVSQAVKSETVDVLSIVYQDSTTSTTQYTALNDILKPFLNSGIRGVRI